jgi:oxalate decarboxylase/phosphoglucose isomerase-like protein (cupin superfamily)
MKSIGIEGRRQSGRTAASVTLVLLLALGAVSGCGSDNVPAAASSATDPGASTEPVVRDRLGATNPQNAPGQELFLEQVTIAPGARLSTHYHQGTQVAHVVSGELTYNIVSGTAIVLRAGADGQVQELATGPTVVVLKAGDGVVETDDVVHYGANDGDVPVVIVLAALLADGAPMATAVDDAAARSGTTGG